MQTRTLLALAAALALAAPPAPAAPGAALTTRRARDLEALYLREGPSLPLSAVYQGLPPAQRHALLGKLREMVLAHLPPGIEGHPALGQLPPAQQAALARPFMLVKAVTPAQLDAFVATQDLDHLAPLPAAALGAYHRVAMGQEVAGKPRGATVAADRAAGEAWVAEAEAAEGYRKPGEAAPTRVELLAPAAPVDPAEVPGPRQKPILGGAGVDPSWPVDLPPAVLVNSVRLSKALNHLANAGYRETPLVVTTPAGELRARDGVELVNGLLATGAYDLDVFDARMFVDFVGLYVPHAGGLMPVRIPTWFLAEVEEEGAAGPPLMVPGNHSEHLLAVYRKGTREPVALVKWFLAIPDPAVRQGTAYKPAIWQRTSWCGYRVVRAYQGADMARQMVATGARLMRLFNFLQDRFQLPFNGYGVLGVCNDTSGILEAVLQGQTGRSTVWPLIRDPGLDFYYAGMVGKTRLRRRPSAAGGTVLEIPSDARPDHYPWVLDRRVRLYRLGANLPFRDPGDLHFPELRQALGALREASGFYAHGLDLQSTQ